MVMKNPDDDVMLTDGEAFFCQDGPYQHHLKHAVHVKDKVGLLLQLVFCFWLRKAETKMFQPQGC